MSDYCLWLIKQSKLLEGDRFSELDKEVLVEFLENLVGEKLEDAKSALKNILFNQLVIEKLEGSAQTTARLEFLRGELELKDILKPSPSIYGFLLRQVNAIALSASQLASALLGEEIELTPQEATKILSAFGREVFEVAKQSQSTEECDKL